MMNRWLSVTALLAALCSTPSLADRIERTLPAAPGQRLEIDLRTGGAITVRAGDDATVSMVAERSGRDAADIEVTAESTSRGARISSRYTGSRHNTSSDVTLELRVPKRFDVQLKTMGGDVHLEGLEGTFEGSTMGGGLELVELSGKADLTTMGGDIDVERSRLDGKVKTMGGRVRIRGNQGDLSGSSMGGEVSYSDAGQGSSGSSARGGPIVMSSMGGDVNVEDAPNAADVSTMGGDVHVRSARGFVKAQTMGGDITLDAVDGWIDAETMGGRITATVVGTGEGRHDVRLESKSGDIHLTVPAGLAMDVEIELEYTRNSTRRYRVQSDFPLQTEDESAAWDSAHGTPRKVIRSRGRIGAGTHRIVLRTVNGDITLSRQP